MSNQDKLSGKRTAGHPPLLVGGVVCLFLLAILVACGNSVTPDSDTEVGDVPTAHPYFDINNTPELPTTIPFKESGLDEVAPVDDLFQEVIPTPGAALPSDNGNLDSNDVEEPAVDSTEVAPNDSEDLAVTEPSNSAETGPLKPLPPSDPPDESDPEATPNPLLVPPTNEDPIQTRLLTIYGDALHPDWALTESLGMDIRLLDVMTFKENWDIGQTDDFADYYTAWDSFVNYDGTSFLAATPQQDEGRIVFSIREDALHAYPKDQVLGVSFWLHSGDDYLGAQDLALTVVGSNENPYWIDGRGDANALGFPGSYERGDGSVESTDPSLPPFSNTRLTYLGVGNGGAIPPQTWFQIVLWLDDLLFDPDYEYVTGFYLTNDYSFWRTFFLDEVQLILLAGEDSP